MLTDQELRGALDQFNELAVTAAAHGDPVGSQLAGLALPVLGALILDVRRIANALEKLADAPPTDTPRMPGNLAGPWGAGR